MCLLTTATSKTMREVFLNTPGLVESIYARNADGIGIMYGTKAGLKVIKQLPKTTAEVRRIISTLPNDDRMVAFHARMRTHGGINLDNCHPYTISATTALMHNGILHTGNEADTTKSDTWHFVKDYLTGVGDNALHDPGMLRMVGDFIENNRFAIMSADGRLSVVNKDQGVESHGMWFSNTYAWDPEILMPQYAKRKSYNTYPRYWNGTDYEALDDLSCGDSRWTRSVMDEPDYGDEDTGPSDIIDEAIDDYSTATLETLLETDAEVVIDYICNTYEVVLCPTYSGDLSSGMYRRMTEAWVAGDTERLVGWCRDHAGKVAEALLYNCDMENSRTTA